MNIFYIPLGSFCYPKMIIRETKREFSESLPFDFNSTPHLDKITNILKILKETNTYDLNLLEIMYKYNENELAIREENMYLVHFFKDFDLLNDTNNFPISINNLNNEKVTDVKNKFKKRFEKLASILNDKNNIICFLRIENYDNFGWEYELLEFTKILSQFDNPNKFLIYSQHLIDEKLHFNNSKSLNYDYALPILFVKHFFYDVEMINNKQLFITILETFEYLVNNENIINIISNDIIEKYYLDYDKQTIFKIANIHSFSSFYMNSEKTELLINNVINGVEKYFLNEKGLYEKISFLKKN